MSSIFKGMTGASASVSEKYPVKELKIDPCDPRNGTQVSFVTEDGQKNGLTILLTQNMVTDTLKKAEFADGKPLYRASKVGQYFFELFFVITAFLYYPF